MTDRVRLPNMPGVGLLATVAPGLPAGGGPAFGALLRGTAGPADAVPPAPVPPGGVLSSARPPVEFPAGQSVLAWAEGE